MSLPLSWRRDSSLRSSRHTLRSSPDTHTHRSSPNTHTGHPRESGDPGIPICPYRSGRGLLGPARARCRSLGRDDGGVCLRLSIHTEVIPRHTPVIPEHTHRSSPRKRAPACSPRTAHTPVIPAKAGIQESRSVRIAPAGGYWIPARARCRPLGRDDRSELSRHSLHDGAEFISRGTSPDGERRRHRRFLQRVRPGRNRPFCRQIACCATA